MVNFLKDRNVTVHGYLAVVFVIFLSSSMQIPGLYLGYPITTSFQILLNLILKARPTIQYRTVSRTEGSVTVF
jgi:hypothetical protein